MSSSNDAMKPVLRGFLEDRRGAEGTIVWFKREAYVHLPRDFRGATITFCLAFTPPRDDGQQLPPPRIEVWLDRTKLGVIEPSVSGPFQKSFTLPPNTSGRGDLRLRHTKSIRHSWYAWLGRVLVDSSIFRGTIARLQKYRDRSMQRSLEIRRILVHDQVICDFATSDQPYLPGASDTLLHLGVNVCARFSLNNGVSEGAYASLRSL